MKKILIVVILITLFAANCYSQKYAVYFTDKNNSPYTVYAPLEFLSQRSIDRRARHNIAITEQDFPVNAQYLESLRNLGANVKYSSKWLNCALVSCSPAVLAQIQQLTFVSNTVFVSPESYGGKSSIKESKFTNKLENEDNFISLNTKHIKDNYGYGSGYTQINQINGIPVHQQNFTGEGVLIAILDGGFNNANSLSVFSSIYNEGRMVFDYDVVDPQGNIYGSNMSAHGTNVLSCISANANNSFVGTAPKASFALIRTEDTNTEYLIECYNWVIGAEAADSIGADIINSSLGYTTFDDASMNFTFSQMNGETAVSSLGAKWATEKGIFVTLSAGNNNGTSFPWVGSPADAANAATIAAVNDNNVIAYFSSIGGVNANKPNTCALGVNATVYSTNGTISSASGTSFSSPVTCGMYACLIQANPYIAPNILRDIVDETGDRFPNHDNAYGFGIPNFANALDKVLAMSLLQVTNTQVNDATGNNDGKLNQGETVSFNLSFHNLSSQLISGAHATLQCNNPNITIIDADADLGSFNPNENKYLLDLFSISLADGGGYPVEKIRFDLNINYDNTNFWATFFVDVYGYYFQYVSSIVYDNANGILDPGENADLLIFINNAGNEAAFGVECILSSSSNDITINSYKFDFEKFNPSSVNMAKFNVTLSNSSIPGQLNIPFDLVLKDKFNKSTTVSFVLTDKCKIIFELYDSFGDGWNNAAINVSFDDGSPSQNITIVNGTYNTEIFDVTYGTNVFLSWISGSWDSECSFNVKYENGEIIYQTNTAPPSGAFYQFENACGSYAAPPFDQPQYAVFFKDKSNSPYSVSNPLAFLSQKAINRRVKYNIAVTEDDLPVNPSYVQLLNSTGAYVRMTSRWGNFAIVYSDNQALNQINALSFVDKTVLVKPAGGKKNTFKGGDNENLSFDYGAALAQIQQLNGAYVHDQGFTGNDIIIAVLDAGFANANVITGLSPLFQSNRVVYSKNVVDPGMDIYPAWINSHGTSVLSCMGGYLPGQFVGTAPDASYALIRTEDSETEYPIEEYFWMIGAELADSIGADLINSSLSYTTFDDSNMNHTFSEMDGKTVISSIAANMAVDRGIFVNVSAGNSNGTAWPWVGTPADASKAFTLGAVDINGDIAYFSSIGPNAAGDLKPNVVACGSNATVMRPDNSIGYASGTSFSSPINCGMVACLIQANNNIKPTELMGVIEASADRFSNPDNYYGNGIPNYGEALDIILSVNKIETNTIMVYPNPMSEILHIKSTNKEIKYVEIFDVVGRKINSYVVNDKNFTINCFNFPKGVLLLNIVEFDNSHETFRLIKY